MSIQQQKDEIALRALLSALYYVVHCAEDHKMSKDELDAYLKYQVDRAETIIGKKRTDELLSEEGMFRT